MSVPGMRFVMDYEAILLKYLGFLKKMEKETKISINWSYF